MLFQYRILENEQIKKIIPLIQKLTNRKFSDTVLEERFQEMIGQNYECAVITKEDTIIGVCGIWYCTRHYAGKSAEFDHVYIDDPYRGQGLGKSFFEWLYAHVKSKGCQSAELNTYVQNYPSHKFYYNEGFEIYGYHFFKSF